MKFAFYAALLIAVGLVVLTIREPAEQGKSATMACLDAMQLAAGGDQAAKDAATTLCNKADAQNQALKQALAPK